ncbi:hypothetical protein [Desulfogranum marinum]|uniref:hypothetical protein n=1 Tax=Desulfogranum marinum TaxID=453220 RepID=UPI0029C85073|nr:hypothetical protein [Desulfogranum marinum]
MSEQITITTKQADYIEALQELALPGVAIIDLIGTTIADHGKIGLEEFEALAQVRRNLRAINDIAFRLGTECYNVTASNAGYPRAGNKPQQEDYEHGKR